MSPWPANLSTILKGTAVLLLAAGCSSTRVHPLNSQQFAPRTAPAQVAVLDSLPAHSAAIDLALVESGRETEKTPAVRARQLAELRERAAGLGADALVDVQGLTEKQRGFIPDPAVPFTAWRQGRFELYFLRARAVRFTEQTPAPAEETVSDTAPRADSLLPSRIRETRTSDPEEETRAASRLPRPGY